MSTNDKKRWKWFKLDKNFFDEHQIKALKTRENGDTYAFIYLELVGNSLNHDGKLRYSEKKPYDIKTLASVIGEDPDVLQDAMNTLVDLELVEISKDKTIIIPNIEKHIGSETGAAMRKREYREKTDDVPQVSPICPPSVPNLSPRDKSIEYRDKSIKSISKPTLEEVTQYCKERNNGIDPQHFIDYYEARDWKLKGGLKIKDWRACIRTWERGSKQVSIPKYDDKDIPRTEPDEIEKLLGGRKC